VLYDMPALHGEISSVQDVHLADTCSPGEQGVFARRTGGVRQANRGCSPGEHKRVKENVESKRAKKTVPPNPPETAEKP
jgi:hypothetical protein